MAGSGLDILFGLCIQFLLLMSVPSCKSAILQVIQYFKCNSHSLLTQLTQCFIDTTICIYNVCLLYVSRLAECVPEFVCSFINFISKTFKQLYCVPHKPTPTPTPFV